MLKSHPDQIERATLKEIEDPHNLNSYEYTRLHDVKYAVRHPYQKKVNFSILGKTPEFQAQAQAIRGEYGDRIRSLLHLQSRLLSDIERHILDEDPLYLESGRALLDSNCHQTALLVLGQLNNWGKMKAAKALNSAEKTTPVSQFGIPKNEADLNHYEVIEEAHVALDKWEAPVLANFNFTDHSAVVLKPEDQSFLCFEQYGYRGPVCFKPLSEMEERWGKALFIKPLA